MAPSVLLHQPGAARADAHGALASISSSGPHDSPASSLPDSLLGRGLELGGPPPTAAADHQASFLSSSSPALLRRSFALVGGMSSPASAQPNILYIMADQMAAPLLQMHDARSPVTSRTPHIDSLARRGVVFASAYCNSPLCAPSRFTMCTGQLPSRIGGYDNASVLSCDVPTYAHYLRREGYETALAGKMHFIGPDQLHGFEHRCVPPSRAVPPAADGPQPHLGHLPGRPGLDRQLGPARRAPGMVPQHGVGSAGRPLRALQPAGLRRRRHAQGESRLPPHGLSAPARRACSAKAGPSVTAAHAPWLAPTYMVCTHAHVCTHSCIGDGRCRRVAWRVATAPPVVHSNSHSAANVASPSLRSTSMTMSDATLAAAARSR